MRNTGIDDVKDFVVGVLFVEFLDDSTGNVDDLYDYFVVHFA